MKSAIRSLASVFTLAAAACASQTASFPTASRSTAPSNGVQVIVRNDNNADMEIFLDRDGLRSRLGLVTGKDEASFVLTRAQFPGTGQLRLALNPLGGISSTGLVTRPVLVNPGETVVVQIGVDLALTRVDVRR
jgi:hypothetical protein